MKQTIPKRNESVDILRGVTIVAMILVNNPGSWGSVYAPLLHAEWHGLTPTDLIFPFFIYIVGISISYAYKNKASHLITYKKIIIRSLKLIGLGLFLAWFLPYFPFFKSFDTLRFPGVLQRIGVVFCISTIFFLNFNWKQLLAIACSILIGYWLFVGYVPFSDGSLPTFDRASNNWVNYIDLTILGEHMWKDDYDPEGLLSTLPAVATCISGILIGKLMGNTEQKKVLILLVIGLVLLVLGTIWSSWFPLNKAIWSSSFVLVTSGWATIILAIVSYFSEVKKIQFGGIFKYVGMNAITIFFLSGLIAKSFYLIKIDGKTSIHTWLYQTFFVYDFLGSKLSSLFYALVIVSFYMLLGYGMYKKKVIIKV